MKSAKALGLIVTLALSLLAAPIAAGAQQVGKVPRIGVLFGSPAASWVEALRQGLRELGYVEGQTSGPHLFLSIIVLDLLR